MLRVRADDNESGRSLATVGAMLALLALLGIALLAATLAGCGQTTQGEGQGQGSPQKCGTVQVRGGTSFDDTNPTQAELCFYHAYQQCQPASLAVNEMGVDAGTDRTFTTQAGSGGGCTITDSVYTYVVPSHQHTATYTCAGLSQTDNGLLFSGCGADGNILVPSASASPGSTPAS